MMATLVRVDSIARNCSALILYKGGPDQVAISCHERGRGETNGGIYWGSLE